MCDSMREGGKGRGGKENLSNVNSHERQTHSALLYIMIILIYGWFIVWKGIKRNIRPGVKLPILLDVVYWQLFVTRRRLHITGCSQQRSVRDFFLSCWVCY